LRSYAKAVLMFWHKIFLLFLGFLCVVIISVASFYELSDRTGRAEINKQEKRSADIIQKVIEGKSSEKNGDRLSLKIPAIIAGVIKLSINEKSFDIVRESGRAANIQIP